MATAPYVEQYFHGEKSNKSRAYNELTIREAAYKYNYSPRSIYNYIHRGLIVVIRKGAHCYVNDIAMEEYIAKNNGPGRPRKVSNL